MSTTPTLSQLSTPTLSQLSTPTLSQLSTDGQPSLPPSTFPLPTNPDSQSDITTEDEDDGPATPDSDSDITTEDEDEDDEPASPKPSPLLRLPAELREMIYTHALGGHIFCMSMRYIQKHKALARADNPPPHALALLLTNRQINSEARLLPFSANTFSGRHEGHLRSWIRALPAEQRGQIKAVKFLRRGYIVESERGVDVSTSFWMDLPNVRWWRLEGLKRMEVEVTLLGWGWMKEETRAEETKERVMARLQRAIQAGNPGVRVVAWRAE